MIFGKNMIFYCCHPARRALARSCRIQMFLSRVNPSHPGKRSSQDGWGLLECRVVNPSPTVCDGPPSPNRRGVSSLILDSATSPFGFAQNDKDGFSNDRDYCLLKLKYSQWPWLISDSENMNTRSVRYIWRWVLVKSKNTLFLFKKISDHRVTHQP